MDPVILIQMAKVAGPILSLAVLASALLIIIGPSRRAGAWWLLPLALALGTWLGIGWVNDRWLKDFTSAGHWLALYAPAALLLPLLRGNAATPPPWWPAARFILAAGFSWLVLRHLGDFRDLHPATAGLTLALAGLIGSVVTAGLERMSTPDLVVQAPSLHGSSLGTRASSPILRSTAATITPLILSLAFSQVIIIGYQVQNAAFVATGLTATFTLLLALHFAFRTTLTTYPLTTPALSAATGITLWTLLSFALALGQGEPPTLAATALLILAAAAPTTSGLLLGERARPWGLIAAAALPALAAVTLAAIITPPPLG